MVDDAGHIGEDLGQSLIRNDGEIKYTRYEKARIIGARALQISMGAPVLVRLEKGDMEKLRFSTIEIAKLEFEKGLVPMTVRRKLPALEPEAQAQRVQKSYPKDEDKSAVAELSGSSSYDDEDGVADDEDDAGDDED